MSIRMEAAMRVLDEVLAAPASGQSIHSQVRRLAAEYGPTSEIETKEIAVAEPAPSPAPI